MNNKMSPTLRQRHFMVIDGSMRKYTLAILHEVMNRLISDKPVKLLSRNPQTNFRGDHCCVPVQDPNISYDPGSSFPCCSQDSFDLRGEDKDVQDRVSTLHERKNKHQICLLARNHLQWFLLLLTKHPNRRQKATSSCLT